MHPRMILAIARKDALDLLINKTTLVMLMTPIILAALFAFIGTILGPSSASILIYNPDNSPLARLVGSTFTNPTYVNAPSASAVAAAFGSDGTRHSSPYDLGIVIPVGFEAAVRAGDQPLVQVYINGDKNSMQTTTYMTAIVTNYARHISAPADPVQVSTVTINPQTTATPQHTVTTFYALAAAMSSLFIGLTLVSNMLVEERERKTMRMLLISPASYADIVIGKAMIALVYQFMLAIAALAITGGFQGQVPLTLLFVLLGSLFSLSLGMLAGGLLQTTSATGALSGIVGFIFIVPTFFLAPFIAAPNNVVVVLIKALPTYYIGEGIYQALIASTTPITLARDLGIVIGSIALLVTLAVWALRRQASVIATS